MISTEIANQWPEMFLKRQQHFSGTVIQTFVKSSVDDKQIDFHDVFLFFIAASFL